MAENNIAVLPICRVIGGSLYTSTPNVKNGQPVLGRDGHQTSTYGFGVAVPKNGAPWETTPWGAVIQRVGHEAWPGLAASPTFAWKVKDGDTPYPNDNGTILKDLEGHPGNWIIWFNTQWKPVVCTTTGEIIPDGHANSVNPGCCVQVQFQVSGNKPNPENKQHKAGVYLNPMCVAFTAHGVPIQAPAKVDPKAAEFTQVAPGQLPPGASLTPVGQTFNPAAPAQQQQQPQYQAPVGAPPPGPYAPSAAPTRTMTALAQYPYDAYIAAGWNDDQLRTQGLMA